MIQPCIVKPGHEVSRSGPRGGDAHAQLSSELGVRRGHEGGHFLVPCLDKGNLVATAVQGSKDTVDAIAGIAEQESDTPGMKPLNDEVTHCLRHGEGPCCPRWRLQAP